jgi:uncharacterized membrane protein YphA (DoxX/SURF4 family)
MTPDTKQNDQNAKGNQPRGFARYLPAIARILMGLAFIAFGLMGLLLHPEPKTPMPEAAAALMAGMAKSGYMMPMVLGTQLLVGVMLLLNRFVPLALVLIMPVLVNIIAFHLFLQPAGLAPGAVLLVFEFYLAWAYRKYFYSVLAARATPQF